MLGAPLSGSFRPMIRKTTNPLLSLRIVVGLVTAGTLPPLFCTNSTTSHNELSLIYYVCFCGYIGRMNNKKALHALFNALQMLALPKMSMGAGNRSHGGCGSGQVWERGYG